jgi:hypothetical protein
VKTWFQAFAFTKFQLVPLQLALGATREMTTQTEPDSGEGAAAGVLRAMRAAEAAAAVHVAEDMGLVLRSYAPPPKSTSAGGGGGTSVGGVGSCGGAKGQLVVGLHKTNPVGCPLSA